MARCDVRRVIHRNGVVEYDDPNTGRHVVLMDGLTVESGENDALAIVTVATVISCSSCLKHWIMPIAEYREGWSACPHCASNLYMPSVHGRGPAGANAARAILPLCGHEFPLPDDGG